MTCGILFPLPTLKPRSSAVRAQSPNQWAVREFTWLVLFNSLFEIMEVWSLKTAFCSLHGLQSSSFCVTHEKVLGDVWQVEERVQKQRQDAGLRQQLVGLHLLRRGRRWRQEITSFWSAGSSRLHLSASPLPAPWPHSLWDFHEQYKKAKNKELRVILLLGGDICIPMADSWWGLTKTNKIM